MGQRLSSLLRDPLATILRWHDRGWQALRRLSGDDGYERYLAHHAAAHPDTPAMTRNAWFAREQERKWNGIKRCC
ncbi:MAG: YbdD/YjiX family protein [Nitrosomonadales bacterium]|nr:YbdD/YjiX family protein [Nitrosomonadales bacterium]